MSDNNVTQNNLKINYVEKSKTAMKFLETIAVEIDMQINALLEKQKEVQDLLLVKQQEKCEIEKSKSNNYEYLFSPNSMNQQVITVLDTEISKIIRKKEELSEQLEQLNEKKNQLSNVNQCIGFITENSPMYDSNSYIKTIDNGIALLETQEKERQRIARDLHDSTVQNLTSLVHKTELCLRLIDMDPIRAKLELAAMSNTIKSVINDMRDIIYNLKPMSLDDLGLIVTVERYARQIMEAQDIKVKIYHNTEEKGILPVINLTLFRIINEACCNIIKHAKATTIEIDINYHENEITVSIKDNGIGFDLENRQKNVAEHSSSFGLSIMKERISLLSGTLKIHSENGKGTMVSVSVPITRCEGDKNE